MQVFFISVALAVVLFLPTTRSTKIYCKEPPEIPFAKEDEVSDDSYATGATVTYACQFGYSARGRDRTLTCEETEDEHVQWTLPLFSCAPQSCGDPGYLNNGRRLGSLFTFPNYVRYECDTGYKLKGLATRYCQTSGAWSGRVPVCEPVTCKPPKKPANGQVSYTSLEYGSELSYDCDAGFHLNTAETVFCEHNGSWSVPDADCVESVCPALQKPEHGSISVIGTDDGRLRAGSIAIFSCDGDRIANGATTSKCLEIGQWTFPPPKCLEPCNIPFVNNGAIGRYVREGYRRRIVFKQIMVGRKVEDDDETLFIRCHEGYEVSGSTNIEEQISCSRGMWSLAPKCQPASCLSEPPAVENGHPIALSPEHGGSVLYVCDSEFVKIRNESVICNYGRWEGVEPICKSTKCSVEDLKFPGLVIGRKSFYSDGQVFEVECDSRHKATNSKYLRCEAGTWKGDFPPCVPASCTNPPPQIAFGKPEVTSIVHSTVLGYVCEPPYILEDNPESQIQCLHGEWEGKPPKCVDSRCRLEDLPDLFHVSKIETQPITLSGMFLHVTCKDGYSPRQNKPFCFNGKWNEYYRSPCEENNCTVPVLHHGDMREKIVGEPYYVFWSFRWKSDVHYREIPTGTVIPRAFYLHLFCHNGYSFQGTREETKEITCTEGKWRPAPVCLRVGQRYIPPLTTTRRPVPITTPVQTAQRTSESAEGKTADDMSLSSQRTAMETSTERILKEVSTVDNSNSHLDKRPPEESCFCRYPVNDENLIAHADGKRLKFYDRVKNGSVVTFRCKHVGFHIFKGVKEIKCEGCRNWHSDELPTCAEPSTGSAVIIYGKAFNVSIEGNLEANLGQTIKLMCIAMEISEYPQWTFPTENGVTITSERMERESQGDVLYVSNLEIQSADFEHEGSYECTVGDRPKNTVEILIIDPAVTCPRFPNTSEISVTYEKERRVGSKALFSCKQPHQQLSGRTDITCLRNGEWSGSFPQCIDIKCKELEEKGLLSIYYTNDRNIGSRATFHCPPPGKRSGVAFAVCLESGLWSDPAPTCPSPPCSLESIYSELPHGVVLYEDDVKMTFAYNTTVKLSCTDDMIVEGSPNARCEKNGKWEFSSIQCVSGCPPLLKQADFNLIVKPEKNVYKLGDTITFSCLPGFVLSTQSERIMCLKNGWSESILPECKVNKSLL